MPDGKMAFLGHFRPIVFHFETFFGVLGLLASFFLKPRLAKAI
jgi:hypothetical protein